MHVAVTGASSGLGAAIAREFGRAGARVTLVARREAALRDVARDIPQPTFLAPHDLADSRRAADWIAPAEAALGPIDVLVSNAGLLTLGAAATFDPEEGERMIAVNLLAPVRIIRAVLPSMLARRSGVIVNVTSMAALVSLHGWAYQAAGKAGSAMYSEALRQELAGSGVHVLTVYPGMTDTPMTQAGLDVYGRGGIARFVPLGDAGEMAARLRRAVEKRRTRMFYPRYYGLVHLFPKTSRWLAARVAPKVG